MYVVLLCVVSALGAIEFIVFQKMHVPFTNYEFVKRKNVYIHIKMATVTSDGWR